MKLRRLTNQEHKTKFIEVGDVFEIIGIKNSSIYMRVQPDEDMIISINEVREEDQSNYMYCIDLSTGQIGFIDYINNNDLLALVDTELIIAPKSVKIKN